MQSRSYGIQFLKFGSITEYRYERETTAAGVAELQD